MTQNDGGSPYEPKPDPETPPTRPLPEPSRGGERPPAPGAPQEPPPGGPVEPGETAPYAGETAPYGRHEANAPYGQPGAPGAHGQPGPPASAQYGYASTPPKNDLGVWALITGILSFVLCPLLLGIAAIITGTMSRKAADQGLANNRGMGTAGLILGWVNVALVVVGILVLVIALSAGLMSGNWNDLNDLNDMNNGTY
jgi:hypothetical protein